VAKKPSHDIEITRQHSHTSMVITRKVLELDKKFGVSVTRDETQLIEKYSHDV